MRSNRLFISFSGGETSAYMTWWLIRHAPHKEKLVVFANTGQEREETLEFVRQCDEAFGFSTVWVEAVVHPERKGSTHKIVDFVTASRDGKPFEAMIQKYGISNQAFPVCTRELKLNPMRSFIASRWKLHSYETAIGIRVDEIDRMREDAAKHDIVYPLVSMIPTTKAQVNSFWAAQPFRLRLKGYEGNCSWCWKKSDRKHATLLNERPAIYDFPERMEKLYRGVGPQVGERVFFRKNRDTVAMREMAKLPFTPATDDHIIYDENWDSTAGCSESCEVSEGL